MQTAANRNGYVPLPFLKPLRSGFALKKEVMIMLLDALCYCYVYYNQGERDGVWFRKNVRIVGAIMKLINFPSEKKGRHRVEKLLLFQSRSVELVGAGVYMVKPNSKVPNIASSRLRLFPCKYAHWKYSRNVPGVLFSR